MFYAEMVDDEGENLMLVVHLINLCLKCKRLHYKIRRYATVCKSCVCLIGIFVRIDCKQLKTKSI